MHKLAVFILLFLLSGHARSQNIYSVLQLNQEREYKTKRPNKIVETNTFFNSSGKQVDKNIKTFDEAGMLLTAESYDNNGNLKSRMTLTNDTAHRLITSRVSEKWTQAGYSKEASFYYYDTSNFLISITNKDASGNVMFQTNLLCNEKGHPVELALFDGHGNSFGEEIATYFYDKNKVVTSVVKNNGRIISSDTIKISFTNASNFPADGEIYNINGDLVHWIRKILNGTETIFEEEYTYDNFGNCTENKIYKVAVKKNGKRKRAIDRIFEKEYSY